MTVVLDYREAWKRLEGKELPYPQTCLVVRKAELVEKNPDLVDDFSWLLPPLPSAWVSNHPDEGRPVRRGAPAHLRWRRARSHSPLQPASRAGLGGSREEIDCYLEKLYELAWDNRGKTPRFGFYLAK